MDVENKNKFALRRLVIFLVALSILYIFFKIIISIILPSENFKAPYKITIEKGQTLFSISKELYDAGAINNRRTFEMLVMIFGSDISISEGEYYFDKPVSVFQIAMRITGKEFGIERKKITFPEGFSNKEMADRLSATLPSFDKDLFLSLADGQEGYLFPDTYNFFPSTTADVIVSSLKKNFQKKIVPLEEDMKSSGHSLEEVIIMASIIEKEAKGENDRELVSGILWNRIEAGIPLQVDAPFLYLLGKESKDLTKKDLAIKSPYNTYINKGLPPKPINNPGLAAITAAIHPESSDYFYYLHDKDGNIHYAKTYAEHKKNIEKYL